MQLGFVGVGTMGAPMAHCLIEAGHHLTVYDLRPEATAALCARGARPADSPGAVARQSEVVFTSLPGPREVELAVLEPSTGILAGFQSGCAYIDMTTNAPAMARRLAEACRARGIDMLDAPVSGRPPTMTVMVGGDEPVFARYRPLFAAMAGNVFYVGEAGAGCIAKLVTQYLGYTNFVAALEGMLIGAKAGIDLSTLARIVPSAPRTAGRSTIFRARCCPAHLVREARSTSSRRTSISRVTWRAQLAPRPISVWSHMMCWPVPRQKVGASTAFRSPRASSKRWQVPNSARRLRM